MNKAEFFRDIDWETPLNRDFITKLYGYSLYDPAFLADVLAEYEKHGRDRVRCVFQIWVGLYEWQRDQELKPVAREIARKIDTEYERKVKEWKKKQEKMTKEQVARQILNW